MEMIREGDWTGSVMKEASERARRLPAYQVVNMADAAVNDFNEVPSPPSLPCHWEGPFQFQPAYRARPSYEQTLGLTEAAARSGDFQRAYSVRALSRLQ